MSFPRSAALTHFTHVPRTGELGRNKRSRVSVPGLGATTQKGGRKVFGMTDLACDRQIFEGHLGEEEEGDVEEAEVAASYRHQEGHHQK